MRAQALVATASKGGMIQKAKMRLQGSEEPAKNEGHKHMDADKLPESQQHKNMTTDTDDWLKEHGSESEHTGKVGDTHYWRDPKGKKDPYTGEGSDANLTRDDSPYPGEGAVPAKGNRRAE